MSDNRSEKATFAGGCFWCMVSPFDSIDGVLSVTSGYTGGSKQDPSYEEVCSGTTGHTEAVEIVFDPDRVSYSTLLDRFWRNIDPTNSEGQFADRGSQYRPAIYYHSDEQRIAAEESRTRLDGSGRFPRPVAVEISPASRFYPAEEYHQDFHVKNPDHYQRYRAGSGRAAFLARAWPEEQEES